MRRKHLLFLLPLFGLTLSGCDLLDKITGGDQEEEKQKEDEKPEEKKDETKYDVDLNSKAFVTEKEEGILHEVKYNEYVIDLLGYSSNEGKLGSLKKATYNGVTYNGMAYNRSLIGNLEKIRVDFSGGDLQYVFTEFLMEDMNFDSKTGNKFESGKPVDVPEDKCYFVIYTKNTTPVKIDSLKLKLRENSTFDDHQIYNLTSETELGGARSVSKKYTITDSYVEMESNPQSHTNNHSKGTHYICDREKGGCGHYYVSETPITECTHCHVENTIKTLNKSTWYRWNGQYLPESEDLGTEFTFGMTIAGEFSRMVDETKFFHYNVWPQFSYGSTKKDEDVWVQTYIGNDNYEPLGKDNALNPSDPYVNESYAGRFFGNYDWYNAQGIVDYSDPSGAWKFGDPDLCKIPDGSKTLREAYKAYNLPFWFIKFHVYLGEGDEPTADIFINGTKVYSLEIFEEYDTVAKPSLHIKTLPMHMVNYGIDLDGPPGDSYTGTLTLPRLIG